ncbi:ATP-binding cassette domain-containing protein [Streptomyces sp. NPDC008079]|uniref:ABC transporter ATP-binding protein n=1 Tax=Streptomyces sp. NPDC008079 TaxID=3364806 RepID=UPI0036E122BA
MTDAIMVAGLHKTFGRTHALDGLDLSVRTGEVHGFLGPNGAGKSTTIRVLLGLIRADGGEARLLGGDPWRDAVALHRRIAYVPGDVTLWPNLSGGEIIDLFGRLRGGGGGGAVRGRWRGRGRGETGERADGGAASRKQELLDRFELDPTKKGGAYSKGNRQKVALVAAFASDADLLILDEPTSGLDPLMEEVFQGCVEQARDRGATVLLSSHILSEVEALCDRVSIIRQGRTVETGALGELRHLTRTSVTAELAAPPRGLDELPGVHDVDVSGHHVTLQADTDKLDALLRALADTGVRSLTSRPPTLEELFRRHYEDPDADGHASAAEGRAGTPSGPGGTTATGTPASGPDGTTASGTPSGPDRPSASGTPSATGPRKATPR